MIIKHSVPRSFIKHRQTSFWEKDVFLSFFWLVASGRPPFVPQERLLKLFIYREEEVEGRDILFSVRFGKIIPIMILLATGRMWLLKMDLWKNSSPPEKHWSVDESTSSLSRTYSLCKFNSRGYASVLKANKSESHNPRRQVPLHVPSRLLSWNFEIAEAELIWRGINRPQHLQSLCPASGYQRWRGTSSNSSIHLFDICKNTLLMFTVH